MSISYWIDASQIESLAEKLFIQVPEHAIEDAKREVAQMAKNYIMAEAPTSFGKESQHTGTPLWSTVTIDIVGDGYSVGPTKKVSCHWDLASIIEFGSAGGQILRPRTKKMMKFLYKGKTWFKNRVIRGSIAPNPFVGRARDKLAPEVPIIVKDVFLRLFREVS